MKTAAEGGRGERRRPRLVTWLSLGVLIFSAIHLIRMALGLRLPPDLPLTVPPAYIALNGGLWGLAGLAATYGLWRGRDWAIHLTRWGGLLYTVWYWLDRSLLARSDYARLTWPLGAVLTAFALGALLWALSRAHVRRYFRENAS